jgi:hypothetical protein
VASEGVARRSRASGSKKSQVMAVVQRFVCCNLRSTIALTCASPLCQAVNPPEAWRTPLCGFGPPGLGHESFVVDG